MTHVSAAARYCLTSRISLAYDGDESNGWSFAPMVAPYGRHVAYVSEASDLVAGDTNNHWDVFAYDDERTVPIFLSIPTNIPGSAGDTVTVPVYFSGAGSSIDSTTFSIDFDHECLSFDPSSPTAIQFTVPSDFVTNAGYDPTDVLRRGRNSGWGIRYSWWCPVSAFRGWGCCCGFCRRPGIPRTGSGPRRVPPACRLCPFFAAAGSRVDASRCR